MPSFSSIRREIDVMDRVTFGKHAGNTWFWVVENFPDYVIWCVGNTDMKFSYQLIVDAIKSKYKKKKEATTHEQDRDNEANAWKFTDKAAYPSKNRANFYDGGLRGDIAHHTMNVFAAIEDKHSDGFQTRFDGFADWDDDVPF